MAVNPQLQGRSLPPTAPYVVGREKVREFAHAVMATDPVSLDVQAAQAAGYADIVAPPTFGVVLQQLALDQLLAQPDTGIDFSRVVHGDQRFTFTRPIVAGDVLRAQLTVTSVKTLAGNDMVSSDTAIMDESGQTIAVATSTLVIRGEA